MAALLVEGLAVLVAQHVDLLGDELDGDESRLLAQRRLDDLGLVDADQGGLQGFLAPVAVLDGVGEVVVDVVGQKRAQGDDALRAFDRSGYQPRLATSLDRRNGSRLEAAPTVRCRLTAMGHKQKV